MAASDLYGVALDAPVVLEIGSAFIRAGLAGEATPRHIVYPSPLADWFPATKSPAEVDDYCDHAKADGEEILILEPMVSPTNFRNAITHILCGKFGFPSLLFVTGSVSVAFFSIGMSHGLLVDVGHAESRCAITFGGRYVPQTFQGKVNNLCSTFGFPLMLYHLLSFTLHNFISFLNHAPPNPYIAVPCGYENVVKLFQSYTTESQIKTSLSDALIVLHNATIAMGGIPSTNQQLSEMSEKGLEISRESESIEYIFPNSGRRALVDIESLRAAWSEVLDVTYDTSIPHMILCSLLQCPMDLRKVIAKNMLLVGGGGCMIQGFQERIIYELYRGVQNVSKFQKLRNLDLRFHEVPFSPDLIPWIGLSIMGTLRLMDEKWIFREAWIERMKIHNYNDIELNGDDSNRETPGLIYDWLHS